MGELQEVLLCRKDILRLRSKNIRMKKTKQLPMPMRLDRRYAIKPQSKRDKVLSLFKEGWSITRIAAKYKVVYCTILRIVDVSFRREDNKRTSLSTAETARRYPERNIDNVRRCKEYRDSIKTKINRHYAKGLAQNA